MALNLPQINILLSGFGATYNAGTATAYKAGTSTLATWYSDAAATTPAANPITLDSLGKAVVYSGERLKLDVKNSAGTSAPGFPIDNLLFGVTTVVPGGAFLIEDWQFVDCTGGDKSVVLLAANDPLVQKTIIIKTDATANKVAVTCTSPSTFTDAIAAVNLTVKGEAVTFIPDATNNIWDIG